MKLLISRVNNGFIVEDKSNIEASPVTNVCQINEEDPTAAIEEVLWFVIEFFGELESRYSKERIVIKREPGDKYEARSED